MDNVEKQSGMRVPKIARYVNTAIAFVLIVLGIYHFTQPNAAWRSGTMESIVALSLLTAAYLVSPKVAVIINVVIAILMLPLGIRHVAIGGGWVSGTIELLFACILIVVAVIINKNKKNA